MTQLATLDQSERILEVLVAGNLSVLTPAERVEYYERVCTSLGLNPLTKPFEFIVLNGKLTLYALKGATDQLRGIHGISISEPHVQQQGDMYIVTVTAVAKDGRMDSDMGVVSIGRLSGENLANAMLKAITKAKRRVTLSICGLGMLDETEIEDESAKRAPVQMPQPRQSFAEKNGPPFEVTVDKETGEIAPVAAPEAPEPAQGMWPAFWAKCKELGWNEAQVRAFADEPPDVFAGHTRDGLTDLLHRIKAAPKPAEQGALV